MTQRERLYPEVKRLREIDGLTWCEIGDRVGVHFKTAMDYYHDPDGSRCRERHARWNAKDAVSGRCPKCGAVVHGSSVRGEAERCADCFRAERAAGARERMDDIAQLWNEGASLKEISRYMGYGPNSKPPILSKMMALGIIEARRAGVR